MGVAVGKRDEVLVSLPEEANPEPRVQGYLEVTPGSTDLGRG
jgi:hypothetical protein